MTRLTHYHLVSALPIRLIAGCGVLLGRLLPFRNRSSLFFFFPFFHTGGAEQVHADLVSCFAKERPWVFFTKRSHDRRFWKQFTDAARCFDWGILLKYSYPFSVGLLAGFIGKHPGARVFGCNSLFYYLLVSHLPTHVWCGDLLHALGGGAEQFALPVVQRLHRRVVISTGIREHLLAFYRTYGVSAELDERVLVIANRVCLPSHIPLKSVEGPLTVLFVGRGSEEKRIRLIGKAARRCDETELAVRFTLVGDLADWLDPDDRPFCYLTGRIDDRDSLYDHYQQADLVVIVSRREGFPLTIMEGMAHGCVPVATAVGGIPEHISHRQNGWLLPAGDDDAVVAALVQAVHNLSADRSLLQQLSAAARQYAEANFSGERFCEQYHAVIRGNTDLP